MPCCNNLYRIQPTHRLGAETVSAESPQAAIDEWIKEENRRFPQYCVLREQNEGWPYDEADATNKIVHSVVHFDLFRQCYGGVTKLAAMVSFINDLPCPPK